MSCRGAGRSWRVRHTATLRTIVTRRRVRAPAGSAPPCRGRGPRSSPCAAAARAHARARRRRSAHCRAPVCTCARVAQQVRTFSALTTTFIPGRFDLISDSSRAARVLNAPQLLHASISMTSAAAPAAACFFAGAAAACSALRFGAMNANAARSQADDALVGCATTDSRGMHRSSSSGVVPIRSPFVRGGSQASDGNREKACASGGVAPSSG